MTLDEQITEAIQQIGGIFANKNIPAAPVNLEYLEEVIAPGMEMIVISELIMHLDDLFSQSLKEEKRIHRFHRYSETFNNILEDNSEGRNLVCRPKKAI